MKKIVAIVTAMMISTSMMSATVFAQQITQNIQRIIEVSGKGIVTAKPDEASIYLAVETKEETAEQAQKANTEITEQVTKALKALGIKDENIVTQYYSVNPDRVYNEKKKMWEQQGYRVHNRFMVKTNDVDSVGKYIDAATRAGVTNVGSVSFSISNPNQYYKQALQAAVKNASSSASALAEALGSTLGSCISVEEMPSYNSYDREESIYNTKAVATDMMAENSGADIRYENIEITAGVTMKYTY